MHWILNTYLPSDGTDSGRFSGHMQGYREECRFVLADEDEACLHRTTDVKPCGLLRAHGKMVEQHLGARVLEHLPEYEVSKNMLVIARFVLTVAVATLLLPQLAPKRDSTPPTSPLRSPLPRPTPGSAPGS